MITLPKEEIKLKMRKSAIFKCKNTESGKFVNPSLEEVLPSFQKCMDNIKFCQRGQSFGTLELIFVAEDTAYAISISIVEEGRWSFYPVYMGKGMVRVPVGAVPP